MVKATANKIVIRGRFIGKPGDNNAFPTAICRNRETVGSAADYRRKTGAKIKPIHSRRIISCASKDGTFERENCFVTPPDGLNGRDASRLRAPWLHFTGYIPNEFGEFEDRSSRGESSRELRC